MASKIIFGNYFANKWAGLSDKKKEEIAQLLDMSRSKIEEVVKQNLSLCQ